MDIIIALLVGILVGGVIMFFVGRNNKKKLEQVEKELKAKIKVLSK